MKRYFFSLIVECVQRREKTFHIMLHVVTYLLRVAYQQLDGHGWPESDRYIHVHMNMSTQTCRYTDDIERQVISKDIFSETSVICWFPLQKPQLRPYCSPGQVAQWVRASSRYAETEGSIPSQGTYKKQSVNAQISGTTNLFLPLSLSPSPSILKLI